MNDTTRDELVERVARAIYTATMMSPEEPMWDEPEGWSDDWTHYYSKNKYRQQAEAAIALVTAARDAEIRELLLSDEAVESYVASVKAAMNLEEPEPTDEDSARLAASFWLAAIGLHGDGTGGQG